MRETFRFSVDTEKEKDILEFLESFPKVLRGGVIKESIKLLMKNLKGKEEKNTNKNFQGIIQDNFFRRFLRWVQL